MNAKVDTPNSRLDSAKWVGVALLLATGVTSFYYLGELLLIYRVLIVLLFAGLALGLAYSTERGARAWGLLVEGRNEVRKVVWPSRQETTQTTLVVVGLIVIIGVFLWLTDFVLGVLLRLVTGFGG